MSNPAHIFRMKQDLLRAQCQPSGAAQDSFDWMSCRHTIPGRIAHLAKLYPDRLASYDEDRSLTYQELDWAANRVANALLAARGPGGENVAIFADIQVAALVVALGVLKCGKAYVGFDDALPEARCAQMLDDSEAGVILCDRLHLALATRLARGKRQVLSFDELMTSPILAPAAPLDPSAMAILNYSSGSTGLPKGVMQSHHSALAQAAAFASMCHLGSADRVTNFGALAWAGTFWTLFGPLCLGACTATFDVRRNGVHRLVEWLEETGVTVIVGLAVARQIAAESPVRCFSAVRLVHLGGDTVYRRDVEACRRVFPRALVDVGLGASETGRVCEWLIDQDTTLEHEVAPVGLPALGMRILLLSENGEETPHGASGEIAVQSNYLASSYWRRPELTAARFRRDPAFGVLPYYLTGDLGRIQEDGSLLHLGRKDFQVKIRGYQVSTSEIEGLLLGLPGILEACVALQRDEEQDETLTAYVVTTPDADWRSDDIRARLAVELPAYMIPRRFVFLDHLPKTPNQKVDRSRLPFPDAIRPHLRTPYTAPVTPVERELATLWAQALGIDRVGVHDDFLSLGGDSLRAAQIISRVTARYRLTLPMHSLFAATTVAQLAEAINGHLIAQVSAQDLAEMLRRLEDNQP